MENKLQLKKWRKVFCIGITVMLSAVMITGCGSNGGKNAGNSSDDTQSKKIPIKIEDIAWSVEQEIVDGEREVVFNYTNNTQYTIGDIEIKFTPKDGVTDEELKVFDSLKEEHDLTDEDMNDLYISGYSHKFAEPKETVGGAPCEINGYIDVENMAQYEIMQPDMATIAYIDDGKGYMVYYDFKSQKYSWGDKNGVEIYKWAEGGLSTVIPQPDVMSVSCTESDTSLGFTSYGASNEQFNKYVQTCKDKGFTVNASSSKTSYNAENSDGYKLSVYYYAEDERLTGNLYAPKKAATPQPTKSAATPTSLSSANTEAWKQFLNDYENWTNSYIELVEKYKENPDDLSLISEYTKIMTETAQWAERAQEYEDELKNDNVSPEVLTEYINTLARITQKIAEAAE